MLNIQTAVQKKNDWLVMQITAIEQLEQFDTLYPNKITRMSTGEWCSVLDGCPIDVTDWLVWDINEGVGVYTNDAFFENMKLISI